MVVMTDSIAETVSLGPRPSYQQKSFNTHLLVNDHRRHKEQVNLRPALAPVKYAETAYVYINNTYKRYVSKTFYEPKLRPTSFSETTYNHPKTTEEIYQSCLDHHADECKKWFKTCVHLEPRKLRSSRDFYPNSGTVDNDFLDENMNRFSPADASQENEPEELYDPGASQVYIPKPSPTTRKQIITDDHGEIDLSQIEGQILLDFPAGCEQVEDYSKFNGKLDSNNGWSDC